MSVRNLNKIQLAVVPTLLILVMVIVGGSHTVKATGAPEPQVIYDVWDADSIPTPT
jgi:hypothetical protein